jgi:hypothetical protein
MQYRQIISRHHIKILNQDRNVRQKRDNTVKNGILKQYLNINALSKNISKRSYKQSMLIDKLNVSALFLTVEYLKTNVADILYRI